MSKKKLFTIVIILILTIAVPLTVFLSQQRQDIRQRASETTNALFFGMGGDCTTRISQINLTIGQQKTLSLCMDIDPSSPVIGFDIPISLGTGANMINIDSAIQGTSVQSALDELVFAQNNSTTNGTIRFAKVVKDTSKIGISGSNLQLGSITFTVKTNASASGNGQITISNPVIVSSTSTTALAVSPPTLNYNFAQASLQNASFESWSNGVGTPDSSHPSSVAADNWSVRRTGQHTFKGPGVPSDPKNEGDTTKGSFGIGGGNEIYQDVVVKQNTTYVLEGWVRSDALWWRYYIGSREDPKLKEVYADLCAKTTSWNPIKCDRTLGASDQQWNKLSVTLNSGNNEIVRVAAAVNNYNNSFFDDITLVEAPPGTIVNPAFEDWNSGAGSGTVDRATPDGWVREPANDGYSRRESGRTGYAWMRTAYGDGGSYIGGYQDVAVTANTNYTLSGWILESNFVGGAQAKLCAYTTSNAEIRCASINTSSANWQRLTVDFNSVSNTAVRIKLMDNTSQTIYWDDISIFLTASLPTATSIPTATSVPAATATPIPPTATSIPATATPTTPASFARSDVNHDGCIGQRDLGAVVSAIKGTILPNTFPNIIADTDEVNVLDYNAFYIDIRNPANTSKICAPGQE